jgi:hypothetical protein
MPRPYKEYNFEDFSKPLRKILNEILIARRKRKRVRGLKWTGPDNIHHCITASAPPPSEAFSDDWLDYHRERGRDPLDVFIMVAIQLGIHQGTVGEEKNTEFYKEMFYSLIETRKKVD